MRFFKGDGFSFELGSRTYIMGILNITPDSFYDGGKYNTVENAVKHAREMEKQGADVIDVGANSTRPDAEILSAEAELSVIRAFLPEIVKAVKVPVSVDTFYPEVAEFSLKNGAKIINDVSSRITDEMSVVIKKYNAGYVVMHNPLFSSKKVCEYPKGVVADAEAFFNNAEKELAKAGVMNDHILFDIGIGFSKSEEDNIELVRNISKLRNDSRALLTALSNKRMTVVDGGMTKDERLFSTVAADTLAIAGGTDFIRVHNVREAVIAAKMADRILR